MECDQASPPDSPETEVAVSPTDVPPPALPTAGLSGVHVETLLRETLTGCLTCPITHTLPLDPVVAVGDGQVYERAAIERWMRCSDRSPMTNLAMDSQLVASAPLREVTRALTSTGGASSAHPSSSTRTLCRLLVDARRRLVWACKRASALERRLEQHAGAGDGDDEYVRRAAALLLNGPRRHLVHVDVYRHDTSSNHSRCTVLKECLLCGAVSTDGGEWAAPREARVSCAGTTDAAAFVAWSKDLHCTVGW